MTNKLKLLFLLVGILGCFQGWAKDSIRLAHPQYISVNFAGGIALPAKVVPNGRRTTGYAALSLKYGIVSRGDRWQDHAFGRPYWGVGVYVPYFSKYYGQPFSVYFLQGARLSQLNAKVSLNYEVNFGVSFNWNHYDYYRRPGLLAIGSGIDVHLAGSLYFKWDLSRRWDIRSGLGFNHFSNGALRTPNYGANALSGFVEVACKLGAPDNGAPDRWLSEYPVFKRRWVHELSFQLATRTLKLDATESQQMNLRDKYPRKYFSVVGFSYSPMFWFTRRFMIGPSLEVVYDESAAAVIRGGVNEDTHRYDEWVKFAPVSKRFSAGLSVKGELVMPGYSVFANIGYDICTKNKRDNRLYQIYGMKVYLYRSLFAAIGVRSTNVSQSKYLFLRVGCALNRHKKDKSH